MTIEDARFALNPLEIDVLVATRHLGKMHGRLVTSSDLRAFPRVQTVPFGTRFPVRAGKPVR